LPVTSIGDQAFRDCSILTSVTIPSSVITIGDSAFRNCSSLTTARFGGDAPGSFGGSVFSNVAPDFTIEFLSGTEGWSTPTWNGYPAVPFDANSGFAFYAWSTGLTGTDAEKLADPDKDGITNIQEYAFGLSPLKVNTVEERPSFSLDTSSGQSMFVLTHRRGKSSAVNFVYRTSPDMSGNVSSWVSAAVSPVVLNPDVDGTGEVELISVSIPTNGESRMFMAIEITE
jgi:hypothetical protein